MIEHLPGGNYATRNIFLYGEGVYASGVRLGTASLLGS